MRFSGFNLFHFNSETCLCFPSPCLHLRFQLYIQDLLMSYVLLNSKMLPTCIQAIIQSPVISRTHIKILLVLTHTVSYATYFTPKCSTTHAENTPLYVVWHYDFIAGTCSIHNFAVGASRPHGRCGLVSQPTRGVGEELLV